MSQTVVYGEAVKQLLYAKAFSFNNPYVISVKHFAT